MWSSTTTNKSTTASDNKKKEEVEDCRCSSVAADAAATGSSSSSSVGPSTEQQNVFEHNSKKQTSTFGGNLQTSADAHDEAAIKKKEQELAGGIYHQQHETADSGFISGPQTSSNIFDSEDDDEQQQQDEKAGAVGGEYAQKSYNIAPSSSSSSTVDSQQQQKTLKQQSTVLDSGCIDDDDDFAEREHDDNEAAVADEQQHRQATNTEHQKQSNATVAATASTTTTSSNIATNDQMILKHNVDAGMSEWFCNLSLQTDPAASQQQRPQQVASLGINNLNGRCAAATTTSASVVTTSSNAISFNQNNSNRQNQQQQPAAGNSATTTALTPSNAWEQFYQQNDDGDTPLHLACISGYVDVVVALIRMAPHPCLFNIQNDEAQTPLHLATLTVQPKILRMLLIAGAEPTLRDRHGNTALHLACISGEEQCVSALTIPFSASEINEAHRLFGHRSIDKTVSYLSFARLPSDLEIRNYDGERCVHLVAQAGHIDILRILVLYGADINAREGKSGRTPLHIAIECCNEDLANFLLDECQKLNLETATYAGLTAYQVACILNKSQMQNILEKRGAELLTPPDSDYDSSDIETDLEDSKFYDRFGDPGYFISYNGGNPMTVA